MTAPAAVVTLDGQAWHLSVGWRVPTPEERRVGALGCRRKITGRTTCGRRPDLVVTRPHGAATARWAYCTDHAAELGHYVLDGVVRHREDL